MAFSMLAISTVSCSTRKAISKIALPLLKKNGSVHYKSKLMLVMEQQ